MANKLSQLKIDRVDGVDDPATGKRFLMAKASDVDDVLDSLTSLQKGVHAMLESFRNDGVVFSKDASEKIAALAKMCEVTFTTKDAEPPAAPTASAAPAQTAAPAAPVAGAPSANDALLAAMMKMSEGFEAVAKGIASMPEKIVEGIAKSLEEPMGDDAHEPAPSSQPAPSPVRKAAGREYGKGLFESVIYPSRR